MTAVALAVLAASESALPNRLSDLIVLGTHTNYQLDEQGMASPAKFYRYPKGLLLFDLDRDIGETSNLADQRPEVVDFLIGRAGLIGIVGRDRHERDHVRAGHVDRRDA